MSTEPKEIKEGAYGISLDKSWNLIVEIGTLKKKQCALEKAGQFQIIASVFPNAYFIKDSSSKKAFTSLQIKGRSSLAESLEDLLPSQVKALSPEKYATYLSQLWVFKVNTTQDYFKWHDMVYSKDSFVNPETVKNLAESYEFGKNGAPHNKPKALDLYKLLAVEGIDTVACFKVGEAYQKGEDGFMVNLELAEKFYKKASASSHHDIKVRSYSQLADLCFLQENYKDAYHYLTQASLIEKYDATLQDKLKKYQVAMEVQDAYTQTSSYTRTKKMEKVVEKFKDSPHLSSTYQEFEKKTNLMHQWMNAFEARKQVEALKKPSIPL